MSKTNFDVFCPACNLLVAAQVIADGNGGFRNDAINSLDCVDTEYYGEHYYICLCGRCNQPFLIRQSLMGIPAEYETITNEEVLYPNEKKLSLDKAPNTIKSAYDQAARSFSASLFEPCVLMCRKCLEATCKTFNSQGHDLKAKLQNLFDGGHIDLRLLSWAHEIRQIGNEAAHDSNAEVTMCDARDILDFTEAILIYVFSLTFRFEAFRARRSGLKTPKNI
jgi:hypothetical protein